MNVNLIYVFALIPVVIAIITIILEFAYKFHEKNKKGKQQGARKSA